jgi:iron complex outermembrane receptor protein
VTAQFRQQNLQDTPIAITAINAELLEARNQTRLSDITAQAPNVLLQPNPSGQGNSMRAFIRGIGQSDQSPSVEPGVGIYVDDIYFATITGSIFDLLDLDRVEILRGPQGTLAGMNSIGGSVKMFSRKPTGEGGYVEATLGNFERRDFRASADFALIPDKLFARVSGVSRHRDGHVTRLDYACSHPNDPDVISGKLKRAATNNDCKLGELGNQQMSALRGSLRFVPNEKLEINIIGDYTNDTSETQASTLLAAGEIIPGASLAYQGVQYNNRFVPYGRNRGDTVYNDPYINYANYLDPGVTYKPINVAGAPGAPNGPFQADPASELNSWGVSGTIDLKLTDNLALKSITGYRKYTSFSSSDNDSSPVALLQNESTFYHKQFSQELRLSGTAVDNRLNYTVGGIYYYQRTTYYTREDDPFLAGIYGTLAQPTFHFIQDDPMVMRSVAGFGNLSFDVTDRLNLSGGIRVTHEDKDYTFHRLALDGVSPFIVLSDPANPLNGKVGNYTGTVTDYRASASYRFSPAVMAYATFSTGFKGGGISPRPYYPQQVRGFGPEKLKSYEIGVKTDLLDRRLRINAAAFYMDYEGYQATPQICVDASGNRLPAPYDTPLCGQYLNVADAKVKGVELEVSARPIDGLSIDAAFSYLDFKFGKPYIATGEVVEGASRPGIGDTKWSAGIQYDIPFESGATLTPRLDAAYTPGYCGNFACTVNARNDAYTLLNGRLTFRTADKDWSISLEVTNITDKLYYLNKFATVYVVGQPGRPREYAVTLKRNF